MHNSVPSSFFSSNRVRDFGIVNRHSWFWKSFNMENRVGRFRFLPDIYLITDIIIDISISMRRMTTKFGNQVHAVELTQMRLTKQVLVITSRSRKELRTLYPHYQNAYAHQTRQNGNIIWWDPTLKLKLFIGQLVLKYHLTN